MTPSSSLLDDLLSARVAFGLRQQGLLPAVETLVAEGHDWSDIGRVIGWDGDTARAFYERERPQVTLQATAESDRGGPSDTTPSGHVVFGVCPWEGELKLTVTAGHWLDVCLPSLAGSGYLWEGVVEADEATHPVVKGPARVLQRALEGVAAKDHEVAIGQPGSERFGLRAEHAGHVRVVFTQRRPFEPSSVPARATVCVRAVVI